MIVVITIVAISVIESRRVPDWQNTLNQYALSTSAELYQVEQARKPWNFDTKLEGRIVYPGRFDYVADITYDGPKTYSIVLPYPPENVICALLVSDDKKELVFANYYSDRLWQDGWVIQKSTQDFPENELLEMLGCDLQL